MNPLPFDGLILMQIGLNEEDEEEIDIRNLRSFLEKDDEEDKEEEERVWVRAKRSISQDLAQKLEAVKPTVKMELPETFKDYHSVFEKKMSERLPIRKPWDHAIDLKPDFIPRDCKIYPMTPQEHLKLEEFIHDNQSKWYIRPSKSPNTSPFFFVSKKDSGKLRPCQDYHRLNDGTIKNTYPLLRVGDLLDKLKGAKYF